jgi:hypothetical protein
MHATCNTIERCPCLSPYELMWRVDLHTWQPWGNFLAYDDLEKVIGVTYDDVDFT